MRKTGLLTLIAPLLLISNSFADNLLVKTEWQALEQMIESCAPLVIDAGKKTVYLKNEKLLLDVFIDTPGYLNVIAVTENGETTLLFPNKFHPDNKLFACPFIFPTPQMKFDLVVQPPFGKTLIAAFFSERKINLYESPPNPKTRAMIKNTGKETFRLLSNADIDDFAENLQKVAGIKTREVNTPKTVMKAGKLELITCESMETCQPYINLKTE